MKVKEIIALHDRDAKSQEHWSFSIYDLSGNTCYGYVNNYYKEDCTCSAILSCDVVSYTIGYGSLFLKIDPVIEEVYRSKELCLMDGYHQVERREIYETIALNLYVKETADGFLFAKVREGGIEDA